MAQAFIGLPGRSAFRQAPGPEACNHGLSFSHGDALGPPDGSRGVEQFRMQGKVTEGHEDFCSLESLSVYR